MSDELRAKKEDQVKMDEKLACSRKIEYEYIEIK